MKAKDRVRMHREKRRAENFSRLDLWIDGRLLADLRTLADYRDLPLRALTQEAFGDEWGDGPAYSPSSKGNAVVRRLPDMGGAYDGR